MGGHDVVLARSVSCEAPQYSGVSSPLSLLLNILFSETVSLRSSLYKATKPGVENKNFLNFKTGRKHSKHCALNGYSMVYRLWAAT
jgi:hypothetical protein